MTGLDPERWRVLSPLLDRALDLPPGQRATWIESLRAQDATLARDIEALLEEHAAVEAEGFLTGDPPAAPLPKSLAGLKLGAYTLHSLAGQGGMGSVWLADRSDGRFEGRAAVKLLNASLIGRDGEARFRREGNLLARLRHPRIAQLVDAGVSPTGQPYLVLEHVDGERIDRYCDAARLGVEARIRLFLEVLAAVAFAHANLVVHRDLKPPNVLVTKDGQVKLLDFGIAKLVESEDRKDAETFPLTLEGETALTPHYAAPEQLTGGTVTTATDVYALGVLLYLLLTGQHPVGENTGTPADWIKAIVDTEARRPSDAVVATALLPANDLARNAASRATQPNSLRRRLKGDLDNIVATALKKSPAQRYLSVQSMADDLRRHLNDEPVSARADSVLYRAVKFARRNRGAVTAAALVMAALLAGTVGIAWQAREAAVQRDSARTQLARATAANEFTTFLLSVAAPGNQTFTVADLLNEGEGLIDKQFADDDALRAEMLAIVGQQYMASERWDKAAPVLERAADIAGRIGDPVLEARTFCPLALLKIMNGDRAVAEAMIQRALTALPHVPEALLPRAECLTRFSEFGFFTGDGEHMIATATEALDLIDQAPFATEPKRIDALAARAYGYYLSRRSRQADEAFAEVLRALESVGRDRTIAAADTLNNWGLLHYLGDIGRAEPLFRRVIELRRAIEGAESIAPTMTFNHAGALLVLGRYAEAEPLFEETIRVAAARHERRVEFDAMMQLADLHIERGELTRAAAQLAKLEPWLDDPRFTPFRQAQLAYYRGRLAEARGEPDAARSQFARAVGTFEAIPAKIGMNVSALIGLARAEQALGDSAGALSSAARALALAQSFVEPDSPSYLVGLSLLVRGDLELAAGSSDAAHASFRSAADHLGRTLGPDHPAAIDAAGKAGSQTRSGT